MGKNYANIVDDSRSRACEAAALLQSFSVQIVVDVNPASEFLWSIHNPSFAMTS